MNELPVGTPVFIWARPEKDLLLLLGEGTYEGFNQYTYPPSPVVKLDSGEEVSVHYNGANIGEKHAVKAQCAKFKGDIIQWDIDRYRRGELPPIEHRKYSSASSQSTATNNGAPLPLPKTATDKLLYLKREIAVEQLKIKAREAEIETSKKAIENKRAEIAVIKDAVLAELSSLDDVSPEAILAAAERIKAAQRAEVMPPQVRTENSSVVPESDDDFHKLATED